MLAVQGVTQRVTSLGITALYIKLQVTGGNRTQTPGPKAQSALRALACSGVKVRWVENVNLTTPPHPPTTSAGSRVAVVTVYEQDSSN